MHRFRLGLLFLLLATTQALAAEAPSQLRFCADNAQWPPFSYSDNNGVMQGFTIDLLKRVAAQLSIDIQIDQLPWKRCLVATDNGQQYQVAIDASTSPERATTYLLSRAYYQLSPYFFYSRRQFTEGIHITQGHQLGKFGTLCGLAGYNYSNFALGQTPIYDGAMDFNALTAMTRRGRCAVFIGRYEIVKGMALIGPDLLADPDLAYAPIPDAPAEPFYLLISRNIAEPEALQQRLNQAIESMSQSGQLEQLRANYQIPLP
ncbi:MAG: transporter substrate-binding domain-containing protein [Motiliproteus sp.]